MKSIVVLVLVALPVSVGSARADRPATMRTLARQVTIYRDTYGEPHVFGRTNTATVFGFAYAQAEDNLWRVEESFILAQGKTAWLTLRVISANFEAACHPGEEPPR